MGVAVDSRSVSPRVRHWSSPNPHDSSKLTKEEPWIPWETPLESDKLLLLHNHEKERRRTWSLGSYSWVQGKTELTWCRFRHFQQANRLALILSQSLDAPTTSTSMPTAAQAKTAQVPDTMPQSEELPKARDSKSHHYRRRPNSSSTSMLCESGQLQCNPTDNGLSLAFVSSSSASRPPGVSKIRSTLLRDYLMRSSRMLFFFTLLLLLAPLSSGEICTSMTLRQVPQDTSRLEKCTVIEGSLVLALGATDKLDANEIGHVNLTFPNLREITDYLLVYQAHRLTTLADLLPNLAVIRGTKLLQNWALVIWQNDHLEEIGLPHLTQILRGGVRVVKNSLLCYVNTIDWNRIVGRDYREFNIMEGNEEDNLCPNLCPSECESNAGRGSRKLCWNRRHCQRVETGCPKDSPFGSRCFMGVRGRLGQLEVCDSECVGGCTGASESQCFGCNNVLYNGNKGRRCLNVCPAPNLLYRDWRCISQRECSSEKRLISYNSKCLSQCPTDTRLKLVGQTKTCEDCKDCPKTCRNAKRGQPGSRTITVTSLEDLRRLDGCTHIDGNLEIQLSGAKVVEELERHLGRVREISGFLKIARSFPIVSLDFFKSLKTIRGIYTEQNNNEEDGGRRQLKYFSLMILENENLQRLFPPIQSVQIFVQDGPFGSPKPGRGFIHYNPKLCTSEIDKLLNNSNMFIPSDPQQTDISYATNGDKAVCSPENLHLVVTPLSESQLQLVFDDYRYRIMNNSQADIRALLGYEIHYREISEVEYIYHNISRHEGRDACGHDAWKVLDFIPDMSDDKYVGNSLSHSGTQRETTTIQDLKAFTYYAVYVTTLIVRENAYQGSGKINGAQSDLIYTRTNEDYPDFPRSLTVDKINYNKIRLQWLPPSKPNGIIDHYDVVLRLKKVNVERTLDRPFCADGFTARSMKDDEDNLDDSSVEDKKSTDVKGNVTTKSTVQVIVPDGYCDCLTCEDNKNTNLVAPRSGLEEKRLEEDVFHDELINTVFVAKNERRSDGDGLSNDEEGKDVTIVGRAKRSVGEEDDNGLNKKDENDKGVAAALKTLDSEVTESLGDNLIEDNILDEELEALERDLHVVVEAPASKRVCIASATGSEMPLPLYRIQKVDEGQDYYLVYSKRVSIGKDHRENPVVVDIEDLKHFGSYMIEIRACHEPFKTLDEGSCLSEVAVLEDRRKRCSSSLSKEVRVMHREGADDITEAPTMISAPGRLLRRQHNETTASLMDNGLKGSNGNSYWISWKPPVDPNELIVNYNIFEYTTDEDISDDGSDDEWSRRQAVSKSCITAKEFKRNGFVYRLRRTGSYYVSVQAISVYGAGRRSPRLLVTVLGPEPSHLVLLVVLPTILIILVIISLLATVYFKCYFKSKDEILVSSNPTYQSDFYVKDHWEVSRTQVTIGEELGNGAFGTVYRGTFNNSSKGIIDCAIKTVREGASMGECLRFLAEAQVMKPFDTPHVVKLLGVVSDGKPHYIVLELMANSDLKTYLRGLRPDPVMNPKGKPQPSEREVRQMALEIADGMAYLSNHEKHIIHRDLAARNCMVTEDVVVKIGDFGLAREIYTTDYYRKEDKGMLPVRWMAPESLKDGVFTSSSDVWSFGIVLWELVTLAEQPYQGCNNQEVMANVMRGKTMEQPESCPDSLYDLMCQCWQKRQSDRPSFIDLCLMLMPTCNDRFKAASFITSQRGQEAIAEQNRKRQEEQLRREQEEEERQREEEQALLVHSEDDDGNSGGPFRENSDRDRDSEPNNGHIHMRRLDCNSSGESGRAPLVRFISEPYHVVAGNNSNKGSKEDSGSKWSMANGLNNSSSNNNSGDSSSKPLVINFRSRNKSAGGVV